MSTLVVGYGNLLRSDDGVGIRLVQEIENQKLFGLETYCAQQLHVELVEEMVKYRKIIFVDAAEGGSEVSLEKLDSAEVSGISSSHHMNPGIILELARKFYGASPEAWLCSIRGENFELGSELSPQVQTRMRIALHQVYSLFAQDYSHA